MVEGKAGIFTQVNGPGRNETHPSVLYEWKGSMLFLSQAAYCRRVPKRFEMYLDKLAPNLIVDSVQKVLERAVYGGVGQEDGQGFAYRIFELSLLNRKPYILSKTTF